MCTFDIHCSQALNAVHVRKLTGMYRKFMYLFMYDCTLFYFRYKDILPVISCGNELEITGSILLQECQFAFS